MVTVIKLISVLQENFFHAWSINNVGKNEDLTGDKTGGGVNKSILLLIVLYIHCFSLAGKAITIHPRDLVENITVESLKKDAETTPSLHFLLATIGRKSILRMLDSLKNQISKKDFLTIVYDAKDVENTFGEVEGVIKNFPCTTKLIMEEVNLGFWGHGIRNKYNNLPGDFILHCDDDNTYEQGSLRAIRAVCSNKDTLYIFKIKIKNAKKVIWKSPKIILGNIDTGSGVIPSHLNSLSFWELKRGGDCFFYQKLSDIIGSDHVVLVDYIIYSWRPHV